MIEGAAILLVGILVGRFLPGRRKRSEKKPMPICGCSHHASYHKDGKGKCQWYRRNSYGSVVDDCGCNRFVLHDDMMVALGLTEGDFK